MKDRMTVVKCHQHDKRDGIFSRVSMTKKQQEVTAPTIPTARRRSEKSSNNNNKTVICPTYNDDVVQPRFFHRQDSISLLTTSSISDSDDDDDDEDDLPFTSSGESNNSMNVSTVRRRQVVTAKVGDAVETKKGGTHLTCVVKEVIAQGYINKKGSGYDWLGNKAWKSRWAVLVRARMDGTDVDVPLLQIFWSSNSPTPSTAISLDSAVVMPETITTNSTASSSSSLSFCRGGAVADYDTFHDDSNHPFRFKICHVKKSIHHLHNHPEKTTAATTTTTCCQQRDRIFSCSSKVECETWVLSINQALLKYEKDMAESRLRRNRQVNNSLAVRLRLSEMSIKATPPLGGSSKKTSNSSSSSRRCHSSSSSSSHQLLQQQQKTPPRYPSSAPPTVVVVAVPTSSS